MATGCIDDDDLKVFLLELFHTLVGQLDRVRFRVATIVRDVGLGGVLLELIKGTGTERVSADHRSLPALALVLDGKLGHRRGLTATLETDKHDDIGLALLGLVRLNAGINKLAELVKDSLAWYVRK